MRLLLERRLSGTVAVLLTVAAATLTGAACAGGSPGGQPSRDDRAATASDRGADAGPSGSPRLARLGRFDSPVEIKAAPGYPQLMFVVEQPGRVMLLRRGRKLNQPFLDLRGRVSDGGERGLLSIAFPPDYRRSGRFYVYFTDHLGNIRVVEYRRRSAVRARPGSARSVITIRHRENDNHNGGQLQFLGHDLYFGTGDGGGGGDPDGHAQNRNSLLGKLIRIDPRRRGGRPYTVPRSNPLVGRPGRDQIFAWGLRNPFRWSFDRSAGKTRIAIGDVGQGRFEEINFLNLSRARGGNFGWNRFEGFSTYTTARPGTIMPSLVLDHSDGNCSVIGGVVVRDRRLPALRGRYLFADLCRGRILSFRARTGRVGAARATGLGLELPTSFGTGANGAVYVTSLNGPVYRISQ
ncbi:MAG: PQQ-dependent sugar dehydrogenase [Solirubrobacterales bacterium]|nr:PQQ-dependent sugar dehydrogenase [Solirubrobacterales bacterium]